MYEILLDFYGIGVKIGSNDKALLEIAKKNFSYFCSSELKEITLEVHIVYKNQRLRNKIQPFISGCDLISSTGATVYVKEKLICLLDFVLPGFMMAVSKSDKKYKIEALLKKAKKKIDFFLPSSDLDALSKALRLTTVYPLMALIKEKKGYDFLHASAVEINGDGFVFVGLPGAGKSRCIIQLLNNDKVNFLSDNYIFINSNGELFAFPEIVRIKEEKGKSLLENSSFLVRLPFKGDGKNYFRINNARIKNEIPLRKIFLIKRSSETKAYKVDSEKFILNMDSFEKFTKDFYEMSYLKLLKMAQIDISDLFDGRYERLKNILDKNECYDLNIKENENVHNLLNQVMS